MPRTAAIAESERKVDEIEEVLNKLDDLADSSASIGVAEVINQVGEGSFSSILLLLGAILLSPVGDIPGAPTLLSIPLVLVAGQLAVGRRHLWLPRKVLDRQIKGQLLTTINRFLRPAVRFVGKFLRRRLVILTGSTAARLIGGICAVLALTLPLLEVVPFGATVPSALITVLALALVARDGLLVLAAAVLATGGGYFLFQKIF